MYFQVTVTYDTETARGTIKKVREQILVDAESCTEAEARVGADIEGDTRDWEVTRVIQSRIAKVVEIKKK